MKIETQVANPESIEVTLKATMNLAQWQKVVDALNHHASPANLAVLDFWHAIRTQIKGLTEYAAVAYVEPISDNDVSKAVQATADAQKYKQLMQAVADCNKNIVIEGGKVVVCDMLNGEMFNVVATVSFDGTPDSIASAIIEALKGRAS